MEHSRHLKFFCGHLYVSTIASQKQSFPYLFFFERSSFFSYSGRSGALDRTLRCCLQAFSLTFPHDYSQFSFFSPLMRPPYSFERLTGKIFRSLLSILNPSRGSPPKLPFLSLSPIIFSSSLFPFANDQVIRKQRSFFLVIKLVSQLPSNMSANLIWPLFFFLRFFFFVFLVVFSGCHLRWALQDFFSAILLTVI